MVETDIMTRTMRRTSFGNFIGSLIGNRVWKVGGLNGCASVTTVRSRKTWQFLCLCLLPFTALAGPLPAPPQLSAQSYMLLDFNSGQVLAESNPDLRMEPASLTKMMTAYVLSREVDRGTVAWLSLIHI